MKKLFFLALLILAVAGAARAQTVVTYTSISSAVTGPTAAATQTSFAVAAVTGITAASNGTVQTILDVDGEAMGVLTVNATTKVVTVLRGYNSTMVMGHVANAIVIVAPVAAFHAEDPAGSCTATSAAYTPWITIATGHQWICDTATTNKWLPVLSTGAITPAASSAAIQTAGQTFTLNGVVAGDPLVALVQPAPTSLCPLVAAAATAANTVTLYFTTLTASACTPAAGTYMFLDPLLTGSLRFRY